ncbi:MAG: hypothetical protein HZA28_01775 [Candidatus Omnitrophica bacterium]|nr:hypothetical protein [Candidatus Omnitrophota bacterium]
MIRKLMLLGVLMTFLSATTFASAGEVFITPNGTKYHKEDCRLIKNKGSLTKVDKERAVKDGYGPCKKCFAEDIAGGTSEDTQKQSKEKSKKEKQG